MENPGDLGGGLEESKMSPPSPPTPVDDCAIPRTLMHSASIGNLSLNLSFMLSIKVALSLSDYTIWYMVPISRDLQTTE